MMLLIILSLCACNEDSTMLSNDSDSKILDEAGSVTESESENEEEKVEETPSRPIPCKGMFKDYYSAQYINFNNCFYTYLVEDMSSMFQLASECK